jgi:hypothetical protein
MSTVRYMASFDKKNIQHRAFAGRHRPNYYSGPHWLDDGRADGIPYFPMGVVVCAWCWKWQGSRTKVPEVVVEVWMAQTGCLDVGMDQTDGHQLSGKAGMARRNAGLEDLRRFYQAVEALFGLFGWQICLMAIL